MTVLNQYGRGKRRLSVWRLFAVLSLLSASGILGAQGAPTVTSPSDATPFRDFEADGTSGLVRSSEESNPADVPACEIVVSVGDGGGPLDLDVPVAAVSILLLDAPPQDLPQSVLYNADSQPTASGLVDPTGDDAPDLVAGAGLGGNLSPPNSKPPSPEATPFPLGPTGQQTKRILGIVPNFEAVSANTYLPPLSPNQKFWLATKNTFDYSSLISVGLQAAIEQARNTYPEFHQGAAAFGRYYWHTFADSGIENYIAGAIFPTLTHEDPRYYTLERGGLLVRTRYAVSRLWITRSDAKASTFNFSEVIGSGVAVEVSSHYYPREARGAGQTMERWASQLINDAMGNVVQEFWPDIHQRLFRRH
jgi:hypothetical protein